MAIHQFVEVMNTLFVSGDPIESRPLVRRERRGSSAGATPARQLSLRPVAIGAVVEVTTLPKPSMQRAAQAAPRAGRP
jgi:hypothetical protein